jgi:alkylhydroperoxidase family enzyme
MVRPFLSAALLALALPVLSHAQSLPLTDADRDALRAQGLSEEDIFDLAETAAFFNLSNRMASATDMMPNPEYHRSDRGAPFIPPPPKPKKK